jgi:uncharacterized protein (DUF488 family)
VNVARRPFLSSEVPMILYTIGFTRKSLRQFIGLLREAGVDGVVDIRLNNTSQLAGYAKRDDLAFILETFGIGYLEEPRLAPTAAILDAYHRDRDWDAYAPAFESLMSARPLAVVLDDIAARFTHPCLLCAEPEPERCHRRLVAEAFARLRPDLEIRHLVLARPPSGRRASSQAPRSRSRSRRAGGRAPAPAQAEASP